MTPVAAPPREFAGLSARSRLALPVDLCLLLSLTLAHTVLGGHCAPLAGATSRWRPQAGVTRSPVSGAQGSAVSILPFTVTCAVEFWLSFMYTRH